MINSKERAMLRGYANDIETILQVGKNGLTETVFKQADAALEARELIKIRVLENAPVSVREAAEALAQASNAQVVQTIGTKAVLFRKKKKDSKFNI